MQYVKGGDLFDCIVQRKRFDENTARLVIWRLLHVVLYLHRRGIVHRDLKPENILCINKIKPEQILVIDFGLSSFFTPKELLKAPCGTLSYVAPEVLRGYGYGKEVDLWSTGVILYVMLRGRLPFDCKNKQALIRKVISGRFSMRNEIWKNVSYNCRNLISNLICVNPLKRLSAKQALLHAWFSKLRKKQQTLDLLNMSSMNFYVGSASELSINNNQRFFQTKQEIIGSVSNNNCDGSRITNINKQNISESVKEVSSVACKNGAKNDISVSCSRKGSLERTQSA